jgi:hypothetical protein
VNRVAAGLGFTLFAHGKQQRRVLSDCSHTDSVCYSTSRHLSPVEEPEQPVEDSCEHDDSHQQLGSSILSADIESEGSGFVEPCIVEF